MAAFRVLCAVFLSGLLACTHLAAGAGCAACGHSTVFDSTVAKDVSYRCQAPAGGIPGDEGKRESESESTADSEERVPRAVVSGRMNDMFANIDVVKQNALAQAKKLEQLRDAVKGTELEGTISSMLVKLMDAQNDLSAQTARLEMLRDAIKA